MALVLMLTLVGAQPAAAAERHPAGRFAGFWAMVLDLPGAHAALDVVTGLFQGAKASTAPAGPASPPAVTNTGWGIDPNGESLVGDPPRVGGG